jgi:hypothetical protein
MNAAMTSLSFITATLISWNCGQASSTEHISPEQLDATDSSMVAFDWGLLPEEDSLKLVTGWYYVVEPGQGAKRILDGDTSVYWLNPEPIVTAKNIATFELYKSNFDKSWGLTMKFNETAVDLWRQATGRSVGSRLALIVRNKLLYAPEVMAEIPSGMTALNRGTYSKGELKAIMTAIQAEQQ